MPVFIEVLERCLFKSRLQSLNFRKSLPVVGDIGLKLTEEFYILMNKPPG